MATLNVSLPSDMVDFVEREVSVGGYGSASDVVQNALRLLQHDRALEDEKLKALQREVQIGLTAAAEGRFSKLSIDDIVAEVLAEPRG